MMLAERFQVVAKRENAAMKRGEEARTDYIEDHQPYVRQTLIPAVETFCSSVWAMVDGRMMPDAVRHAVADAHDEMAARHVERVREHANGAVWEAWPPDAAESWAEIEMNGLVTTMTAICREHSNDN